ncbi:MAG TPA: dockerin type I domain-containing protein, partial [Bacteroidia bacterium]|nr:dockerin type I domain-containing protein [Bacteroidia bacterium]
ILATATYPITLALHTQPNSDVKVTFVSETNAEINVSPEAIIFSPNNWNVNQAISFSNNKIKESNKNYLVNLFTTSDDISYNNLQDILELTVFDKGTGNLHNPFMQYDVNDDDTVSSQDVLIIFNALNNNAFPSQSPPYLDVSDDGHITPLDALQVINYINNQEAEAENIQSQFFQPLQNSFNPPTVDLIFQNDFFLDSFFQKKEKKLKHRRQ